MKKDKTQKKDSKSGRHPAVAQENVCCGTLCVGQGQGQAPRLAPGHGGRLTETDASARSLYHYPFHLFPPSQTPPKSC